MIRKYLLVTNKHLQLQLLLIKFLSIASAEGNNSNVVEMTENSTQSNQVAGKCSKMFYFHSADLHNQFESFLHKCATTAMWKFPFNYLLSFVSSKLIATSRSAI